MEIGLVRLPNTPCPLVNTALKDEYVTHRVYYRDLFDSRTNSVKQLWNNLNHIVSLGKNKGTNNIQQLRIGSGAANGGAQGARAPSETVKKFARRFCRPASFNSR